MNFFFILLLGSWIFSTQSTERTEFKNLGTHFERNTYEDAAKFEDFALDELLTHNLTREDYKVFIKKGLKRYFKIINAIKENKKIANGNYIIENDLNLTKAGSGSIAFDSVQGFSTVKIENPHVTTITKDRFQILSLFHFPQLIFSGHLIDQGKPFKYKWFDVYYETTEYKKVENDFQITSIQISENIRFDKVEVFVGDEKSTNKMLEREIQQKLSDYLFDIINFLRTSTTKYWLGADNWYLRQIKDKLLDELSRIVVKTVETFKNIDCELPRFAFRDEQTSTNYEMINGNLEIDATSVQTLTKNANELGDIEITFPIGGGLKYYVAEQNCTSACHFYGHRFEVLKANVRISFSKVQIQNVQWFFEMKYAESLVDNHFKVQNDALFNVVLENVSKVVNERFLVFLKSFLGQDFV